MAIRSGTISVGDKVVLVTGINGQRYAVKPASPQVGDKVILYPLRNGGYACLFPAGAEGAEGEPSHPVMPPANFHAVRTGPSTAYLDWFPGEGNTAVRIVRRSDRYPVHINDGTVAYEGAGREAVDGGLDYRSRYYYCAWGRAGSRYSNGYLMDWAEIWLNIQVETFGTLQLRCSGSYSQTPDYVYLYSAGSAAQATSVSAHSKIGFLLRGDGNDGIAQIYVDGVKIDEFCTKNYPKGTRYYDVAWGTHTAKIAAKGVRCGESTDAHVHIYGIEFC